MARPAIGTVVERRTRRGVTYALRFRAYGRREYLTLGRSEDGWTRQKADDELQNVLADVRRGLWRPARPEPTPEPPPDPTFHEFASEWFAAKRRELRPSAADDYEWQLTHHLLLFFGRYLLIDITVAEVDGYREAKVAEAARRRG
jgi:hypothetical protein